MSDRVAFARLDHEHEVAELRREVGVLTDERDTALAEVHDATKQWQFHLAVAADLSVQNERLRQIVGGDGELESALDVTLDGALAAVRHFAAERDALSADFDRLRRIFESSIEQGRVVDVIARALCDQEEAAEEGSAWWGQGTDFVAELIATAVLAAGLAAHTRGAGQHG